MHPALVALAAVVVVVDRVAAAASRGYPCCDDIARLRVPSR